MEKRIELEKRGRQADEVSCNEKRQNKTWPGDASNLLLRNGMRGRPYWLHHVCSALENDR